MHVVGSLGYEQDGSARIRPECESNCDQVKQAEQRPSAASLSGSLTHLPVPVASKTGLCRSIASVQCCVSKQGRIAEISGHMLAIE